MGRWFARLVEAAPRELDRHVTLVRVVVQPLRRRHARARVGRRRAPRLGPERARAQRLRLRRALLRQQPLRHRARLRQLRAAPQARTSGPTMWCCKSGAGRGAPAGCGRRRSGAGHDAEATTGWGRAGARRRGGDVVRGGGAPFIKAASAHSSVAVRSARSFSSAKKAACAALCVAAFSCASVSTFWYTPVCWPSSPSTLRPPRRGRRLTRVGRPRCLLCSTADSQAAGRPPRAFWSGRRAAESPPRCPAAARCTPH